MGASRQTIGDIVSLMKWRVSLLAAFSAAVGMILSGLFRAEELLLLFMAFFLTAAGASILNHIQDRDIDRKMRRTRDRPIPAGRVSVLHVFAGAAGCLLVGGIILARSFPPHVFILACAAVIVYNGFYPWLRRRFWGGTFVGALSGVLPVMAGWAGGGGSLTDSRLFALAVFSYTWQVPHFWLLILRLGHEYESAGLPTPGNRFDQLQLGRITFAWILGLVGLSLSLPLFGLLALGIPVMLVAGLSVILVWKALPLLGPTSVRHGAASAFRLVTGYSLAVMVCMGMAATRTTLPY